MKAPINPADIPGKKARPFDAANFLLGRGAWILVAGLALAMLLAPLAFLKRKPYYFAGGSLLVSPNIRQFLSRQDRTIHGSFRDFADTQAKRLLTGEVLSGALETIPETEWPAFLWGGDSVAAAADALRPRLEVKPVDNSYLLFVSLTSDDPGGMAEMVNAVMESYIRKLEREQEAQSQRRLDYLRSEKESILAEIEEKKARQNEVAAQLNSRSFNEFKNPYFESVVTMQEQYLLAKAKELETVSEVDLADRNIKAVNQLDLEIYAEEAVARNEAVYLIDTWTYQKLQELRGKIDGLTPENPDRIYVEERMTAMTDYLENFRTDLHEDFDRILTEKRAFELNETATKARTAREAAAVLTQQLGDALKEAEQSFQRSTELIAEGQELSDDIELLRNRLALVEDSIRDVSLDSKEPTHVSIEERATPPAGPVSDNLVKYLALIAIAAFGVTGTAAGLLELLDTRIRGVRDLRHALGTAAPEPVPNLGGGSQAWSDLVTLHQADHPAAAAVRKLVVRLNQEKPAEGASLFLFTGAHREAGTTSLTRNAAAAFGQYRARILCLEITHHADAPVPPVFDADAEATPETLASNALERIRWENRTARLQLDVSSPVLHNRFALEILLGQARTGFDAILIDGAPLLESDLTQFLVQIADASVVVARDRRTHYGRLRAGIEFLYQSSIPAFTAVLVGSSASPLERLISWKDDVLARLNRGGLRSLFSSRFGTASGAGLPIPQMARKAS